MYEHREGAINQTGSVGEESKSFSCMMYELYIRKLLRICQAEKGKEKARQDEKKTHAKNISHKDNTNVQ